MALDLEKAADIGLFPRKILSIAQKTGNSAGKGAALCLLSENMRKRAEQIASSTKIVELSGSDAFEDRFIEAMMF